MWDLAVRSDHDFYVVTAAPVLVHNCPVAGGEEEPSETVAQILRNKKGSIMRAPLPSGAPSWQEIMNMTLSQVRAAARENRPGFRTILKLLTDRRFNR
jgi:hypothetical protein